MNLQRKLFNTAALAAVLALAGCWDDDDADPIPVPPVVITEVPDSAGVSTAAFFGYLMSLSPSDESAEPLTVKATFAVPADESAEPTPLR